VEKVRVLVVDDSAVMRKIIASALQKEPSIEIVGFAANGLQAIEAIQASNPDVVTLDIEMPEMDGLTALREIRKENKYLPIIMFSSLTHKGAQAAVIALTAGASDYVGKPTNTAGGIDDAFKILEFELIPKIIGLAKRVKTRRAKEAQAGELVKPPMPKPFRASAPSIKPELLMAAKISKPSSSILAKPAEAVCIGVSTGGPEALMQVFSAFNVPINVPIFIVQHMPTEFTALLAARLSSIGVMTVKEGEEGEIAEPAKVYVAPGGFHMTLSRSGTKTIIHLNTNPPENSCRPAVDVLFKSAAAVYGNRLLGFILTGMGYDGLKGAQIIKELGGQVIAQDEASSVIWGMPGAVVQAGLADSILPIDKVADEIVFRTRKIPASR
jgi:two-component system chemotaxis response regulator CheB